MPSCLKCGRQVDEGLELFCPRCLEKAATNEEPAGKGKFIFSLRDRLRHRWRIACFMVALLLLVLYAVFHLYPYAHTNRITMPDSFSSIQEGIEAAESGDTIVLAPGVYYENIDFMGKAITLRSINPRDPDVVASTVIQGNGKASTVLFQSGETGETVLQGLTIAGGEGTRGKNPDSLPAVDTGGVIFIDAGSTPLIRDNNIISGTAWRGGAVFINNASPSIINNTISGNHAHWKGGAFYISDRAKPVIRENNITNNRAEDGGGIYVVQASPLIEENWFEANSALYQGGGIMLHGGSAEIRGNLFKLNRADECGGAAVLFEASPLLRNNHFERNIGGWRGGGGLYIGLRSAPQLVENVFKENEALEGNDIWVSADSSLPAVTGADVFYQD